MAEPVVVEVIAAEMAVVAAGMASLELSTLDGPTVLEAVAKAAVAYLLLAVDERNAPLKTTYYYH